MSDSLQPHGLQLARLLCPWISQAKTLDWVSISLSRGSSWPRDQTHVSCLWGGFFTTEQPWKPAFMNVYIYWFSYQSIYWKYELTPKHLISTPHHRIHSGLVSVSIALFSFSDSKKTDFLFPLCHQFPITASSLPFGDAFLNPPGLCLGHTLIWKPFLPVWALTSWARLPMYGYFTHHMWALASDGSHPLSCMGSDTRQTLGKNLSSLHLHTVTGLSTSRMPLSTSLGSPCLPCLVSKIPYQATPPRKAYPALPYLTDLLCGLDC